MTRQMDDNTALSELDGLLLTWGGDESRWPVAVRARISVLAQQGPAARRLIDEARALDRVLDAVRDAPAHLSRAKTDALTSRIMAAATNTGTAIGSSRTAALTPRDAGSDNVVAFPLRPRPAITRGPSPVGWQAAGLIAACLLAGVYLGGTFNMLPVLQELAEAAGITSTVDPTIASLGDDLSDEDTL